MYIVYSIYYILYTSIRYAAQTTPVFDEKNSKSNIFKVIEILTEIQSVTIIQQQIKTKTKKKT